MNSIFGRRFDRMSGETMDNVRKIITPTALWSDFNDSLPLKESKVNEMIYDGIIYSEVYFSGRETESGRVRIYGLYARPQNLPAGRKIGGILILPDCSETVNLDTVNYYVRQGYAVLMVDYRGEYPGTPEYTNYPTEIDYANLKQAGDIFHVERTAKECCWYEWAAVAKYAAVFLQTRPEVEKIALIGIKQGANVGWQSLYGDKRISCFISVYGIGWQAYKGVFRHISADIELDDERYRWLGGVDAHVYAQYVNCPVLYVAGTNSSDFDCDRGPDTLQRLKPDVEHSFNYAPRFRDTINKKCGDDILIFLKRHLSKDGANIEKYYFPAAPQVKTAAGEDGVSYFAEVTVAEPEKLKSLAVYLSEGVSAPGLRNWQPMQLVKQDKEKKYYHAMLGGDSDFTHAFAVAEYKNGVTVSSKIVYGTLAHMSVRASNMLYTSEMGADCFTPANEKLSAIGGIIFNESDSIRLAECSNGITGVTSRYGLLTYKIGENRFKPGRRSILKFDVFSSDYTVLKISLLTGNKLGELEEYSVKVNFGCANSWYNVQVAFTDFKNEMNFSLKDFESVSAIKIESDSLFAINNVLLI